MSVVGVSVALMFDVAPHPLFGALDDVNAQIGRMQRQLLQLIADADRRR
jgi:hypothetical protein